MIRTILYYLHCKYHQILNETLLHGQGIIEDFCRGGVGILACSNVVGSWACSPETV